MLQALQAMPEDDEPSTPEEDQSATEAWQAYLRGEAISADEAKREFVEVSHWPPRVLGGAFLSDSPTSAGNTSYGAIRKWPHFETSSWKQWLSPI
jgi:hypothetical protein